MGCQNLDAKPSGEPKNQKHLEWDWRNISHRTATVKKVMSFALIILNKQR